MSLTDFLVRPVLSIPLWFWLMILTYVVLIPGLWFAYRRWLKRLDRRLGILLYDFLSLRFGTGLSPNDAKALAQKTSGVRFRTLKHREKGFEASLSMGFGLAKRRGRFLPDQGAVVYPNSDRRRHASLADDNIPQVRPLIGEQLWPLGDRVLEPLSHERPAFEHQQQEMAAAFSKLFDPHSVSVAIQHRNRLVWESYADGFDENRPQLCKAVTPFVFSTVFGFLSHQRRLAVEQAVPEQGWGDDSRNQISYLDLLTSTSGLAPTTDKDLLTCLYHPNSGSERDKKPQSIRELIAGFRQTKHKGAHWDESATSVFALSHLLSLGFGSRDDIYRSFVRRTLFDKLGMVNTSLAVTSDGLLQTWSGLMSTPRDLLRLASLYQSKGFWQGERMLEDAWIDLVNTPTEASGLSAAGIQSFLNANAKTTKRIKAKNKAYNQGPPYPALPQDALFAMRDGFSLLALIPSEKLSVSLASVDKPLLDTDIESFLRRLITFIQNHKVPELQADPHRQSFNLVPDAAKGEAFDLTTEGDQPLGSVSSDSVRQENP